MKRLILDRVSKSPHVTFGVCIDAQSGIPLFVTLERPWKMNVPYISCSPTGIYICEPYSSDKFKDVYQVMDVPGRTHMLWHIGNYIKQTQGCTLPGTSYGVKDGEPCVENSAIAMQRLRDVVGKNKFILEIT